MKKKVTINLSNEAIAEIQRIAKEERRSVSAMIEELIFGKKKSDDNTKTLCDYIKALENNILDK